MEENIYWKARTLDERRKRRQAENRLTWYGRLRQGTRIGAWILLLTFFVSCILVAAAYGYRVGQEQIRVTETVPADATVETYVLDGQNYTLVPDAYMPETRNRSVVGYTYTGEVNASIYMQKDRSPTALYETCVHESLHTYGVSGERHDEIGLLEDQVVVPNCLEFLYAITPPTN